MIARNSGNKKLLEKNWFGGSKNCTGRFKTSLSEIRCSTCVLYVRVIWLAIFKKKKNLI